MEEETNINAPSQLELINASTITHGFNMASEIQTGAMLRFLCASKPAGKILELGTGTGFATSWIIQGMDADSMLVSVDNDDSVLGIARQHLGDDVRVQFILSEGIDAITSFEPDSFDLIFADAWDGKYYHLNETIDLLKKGGIYIVDDMLPRATWHEGHQDKVNNLINQLECRDDMFIVKLCWASGLILGVKK
jgi:predicted O-methyltransferase YrrM